MCPAGAPRRNAGPRQPRARVRDTREAPPVAPFQDFCFPCRVANLARPWAQYGRWARGRLGARVARHRPEARLLQRWCSLLVRSTAPELGLPRPGVSTAPLMRSTGPRLGCRARVDATAPERRLLPCWRHPPRSGGLHRPEDRAAPCPPRPSVGCRCAGVIHEPEVRAVPWCRRWWPPPRPSLAPCLLGPYRARVSAAGALVATVLGSPVPHVDERRCLKKRTGEDISSPVLAPSLSGTADGRTPSTRFYIYESGRSVMCPPPRRAGCSVMCPPPKRAGCSRPTH